MPALLHPAEAVPLPQALAPIPTPAPQAIPPRIARLRGDATRATPILELGPSHAPVAPKRDGWNTYIADHAGQQALREKYAAFPVDIDAIEPVDAIWNGGPLHQAIPARLHGRFGRLIASHVIEHLPDPIAFLASAQALLAPEGVLALAVPDKRYCFDCLKPHSTTADLLASHERADTSRHTLRTLYLQAAHSAFARPADSPGFEGAWGQHKLAQLRLTASLPEAYAAARAGERGAGYQDAHAWQFTPCAFALAILELAEIGLADWHVAEITATEGSEFFAMLRRGRREWPGAEAREAERQRLLLGILAEQGEQIAQMGLLPSPAPPAEDLRPLLALMERQLASITDADGTQASMMGSLALLLARLERQQAQLEAIAQAVGAKG